MENLIKDWKARKFDDEHSNGWITIDTPDGNITIYRDCITNRPEDEKNSIISLAIKKAKLVEVAPEMFNALISLKKSILCEINPSNQLLENIKVIEQITEKVTK